MSTRRDRAMMSMMAATGIVKNIRPECMNAAETIGSIADALATRDIEIERLQRPFEFKVVKGGTYRMVHRGPDDFDIELVSVDR
jgi:hypothetical protein